jgi:hypothetical protein
MDVLRFQQAVRSLVSLAEDLWIQTEVYRGYILETGSISEEELESLTQAASFDAEIQASAHQVFSRIFERLDEPGTHAVIDNLLSLKRPTGRMYS